ncbi:ABC transporter permease [Acetobacter sp. TBRC 12305]|uniref:ABC transporter permease n=1 Tax=Acetobacter garciniae TaxID=2817435 RepID=A0A939HJI0_9PROT|nr:ABC transporter permease [Acetobacter garciniae]MBO1325580.1 ABC transporter permease [Acetobacter garciniae]MBX0345247.1 ABC transporter permease [Acetobacter garciniae]
MPIMQNHANSLRIARVGTVLRAVLPALLTTGAVLAAWQALCWSGRFPPPVLVAPSDVWATLADLARNGDLARNWLASIRRVVLGVAVGGLAGFLFGILCGTQPRLWRQVAPSFAGLRQVPFIVLGPLLIMVFGINETFIVFMLAVATFFPLALAVIDGLQNVSGRYEEVTFLLQLGARDRFRLLYLPAILPALLTGSRIALNRCWGLVVAAELFGASSGLGQMMNEAREMFDIGTVMAGAIVTTATGLLLDMALRTSAARVMYWKHR